MTILETSSLPSESLPCSTWATEADLCSPCNDYAYDSALMDEHFQAASEILYQLSAQQFPGECEETIRPCTRNTWSIWRDVDAPHSTVLLYRRHGIVCGCGETDTCGCGDLSQIRLPHYPITEVTEVKIDGAVFTDYRVDDSQYLVRTDGERWPCCQDLSLEDTEEDTWSVTYSYGREPPVIGRKAAAILACELYMACNPEEFEGQCRLPRNIVSVARQGVTVLVSNAGDLFLSRHGEPTKFGIWEIDMFLRAYNPYGRMSSSIVLTPDLPPTGKRVGT